MKPLMVMGVGDADADDDDDDDDCEAVMSGACRPQCYCNRFPAGLFTTDLSLCCWTPSSSRVAAVLKK